MKNIWEKIAKTRHGVSLQEEIKPFFILAPMAGVTDSPFRQVITEIGSPDLMFTEFVSTEMIWRNFFELQRLDLRDYPEVQPQKIPPILKFSKKEKPLIVQFFGCKPDQFRLCARLALQLGFDGIDINVGCPDKKVQKQGSGSELIKNPKLVREIIRATVEGCGGKLPVSIKTRLGYDEKNIKEYLEALKDIVEKENIAAITIHGRTAKQGYGGKADWEMIGRFANELKKSSAKQKNRCSTSGRLVVIGNGDVKNIDQGCRLAKEYGVDGVMIGREILHNPWLFNNKFESPKISASIKERLELCLDHTKLFVKNYGKEAHIGAMKKYYKGYLSGLPASLVAKKELMNARNIKEAEKILKSEILNYKSKI